MRSVRTESKDWPPNLLHVLNALPIMECWITVDTTNAAWNRSLNDFSLCLRVIDSDGQHAPQKEET